jgi:uncharacterized protein (DUF302 family)
MDTSRFYVEHVRLTCAKRFEDVRTALEQQLGKFDPEASRSLTTGQSPNEVRKKLEGMAGSSGFMLFATQDHGTLLRIVGLERKALQFVIGNPLYAIQMTQYALGASLYAPLRMLLYENEKNEVCVEYDLPSSLFAQFHDDRVKQVALSLDRKMQELVARAMR